MKLDFNIQDSNISLAKMIDTEMIKNPKKVYMFIGIIKEAGFNIIEESIVDSKAKISIFMGVDKKNTTKNLLTTILSYTKDVYVHNNNDLKEFESNIYVFEYEKVANIYVSASNASESGLTENMSVITKIVCNLVLDDEKKEYKENMKKLTELKNIDFKKLDGNLIDELLDTKVIFSNKQYDHNVKSISQFLGKPEIKKENKESDEDIQADNFGIPVIDLSNSILDIDLSDVEDVSPETKKVIIEQEKEKKDKKAEKITKQIEEQQYDGSFGDVVDISSILLTKSKVKLSEKVVETKEEIDPTEKEEVAITFKKLDLNNISNYMFELPSKQQNGVDLDVIKIPNYIRELIPKFFEFPDKAKTKVINGAQHKLRDIQVEIVDAKNNTKVIDKNAKIIQKKGQTYFCIMSKFLEQTEYEEKDIARIIKLSDDVYHIEIVSKDMQEYKIWSKIMNKKLKGVDRKYGIM
ncbi:MAG: hypothetical protein RR290_03545 [Clostridia bacterium]